MSLQDDLARVVEFIKELDRTVPNWRMMPTTDNLNPFRDAELGALKLIDTHHADIAGLARDAERFRWMHDNCFYAQSSERTQPNVYIEVCIGIDDKGRRCMMYPGDTPQVGVPSLDQAIDAAIAATQAK